MNQDHYLVETSDTSSFVAEVSRNLRARRAEVSRGRITYVSFRFYNTLTKRAEACGMGGAELQGNLIMRELAKRGYDVTVVTASFDPDEIPSDLPFRLVPFDNTKRGIPFLRLFVRARTLQKTLEQIGGDLILINIAGYILTPAVLAARKIGSKVMFWAANDSDFDPSFKHYGMSNTRDELLYLWGMKNANYHIVQNGRQQKLLREQFGKESRIIYNGLPRKDVVSTCDGPILWIAGHIRKEKDPMMFLDLAEQVPEARFVMIGGNPVNADKYTASVFERARRIPNVDIRGFMPFGEVEELFRSASLLVNTSIVEGFPNTFIQAWSRGVPVVSTHRVNPDFLITKHKLGAVCADTAEMASVIRAHLEGRLRWSPPAIKRFFDDNLSIETLVDKMEEALGRPLD
jgi:glycosyltransferase involved in cell wall biosynthesis